MGYKEPRQLVLKDGLILECAFDSAVDQREGYWLKLDGVNNLITMYKLGIGSIIISQGRYLAKRESETRTAVKAKTLKLSEETQKKLEALKIYLNNNYSDTELENIYYWLHEVKNCKYYPD